MTATREHAENSAVLLKFVERNRQRLQALGRAPEPSRRAGGGISFALGDLRLVSDATLRDPPRAVTTLLARKLSEAQIVWSQEMMRLT